MTKREKLLDARATLLNMLADFNLRLALWQHEEISILLSLVDAKLQSET